MTAHDRWVRDVRKKRGRRRERCEAPPCASTLKSAAASARFSLGCLAMCERSERLEGGLAKTLELNGVNLTDLRSLTCTSKVLPNKVLLLLE